MTFIDLLVEQGCTASDLLTESPLELIEEIENDHIRGGLKAALERKELQNYLQAQKASQVVDEVEDPSTQQSLKGGPKAKKPTKRL